MNLSEFLAKCILHDAPQLNIQSRSTRKGKREEGRKKRVRPEVKDMFQGKTWLANTLNHNQEDMRGA